MSDIPLQQASCSSMHIVEYALDKKHETLSHKHSDACMRE